LPAQPQNRFALDAPLPPKIVAGEVIVHFRPGITDAARDQSLAPSMACFSASWSCKMLWWRRCRRAPRSLRPQSLEVDPNVVSAEPNGNLRTSELP
jgi:hypothetical protein